MSLLAIETGYCGYERWKKTVLIQRYMPERDIWKKFSLKTPADVTCIAELNNQLIFITLLRPYKFLRYDICTRTWPPMSQITPLDHEKACTRGHCFAVLNGQLYAMGGLYANYKSSDRVERWDPKTDTWSRVGYLKNARCWAKSEVLNGELFVAGGKNGNDLLPYTEQYRPITQEWKRRANINVPRTLFGFTAFNGCLYAAGGSCNTTALDSVERYDPKSNKWTKVCSLNEARSGVDCIVFENRLWAIGGPLKTTIELYDAVKDTWTLTKPLHASGTVKCIVLPNHIADCLKA